MPSGASPLDKEALILVVHRTFGSVGAHGCEPQERIEGDSA
jgi:hypothetical protein